jgi:membrane protein required for colicin V production
MLTAFDVGIAVLVLISAILATARGFTREVLSLATWAGSAAIAAYMYFYHKDIARGFIQGDIVPDAVTVIGTFLVSLIILHLITMWIADLVVDSRVGPLDRTLGFLFGIARGILISIVVTVFGVWLLQEPLPPWAAGSKSLPILRDWGNSLIALLPDDLEKQLTDILQKRNGDETIGADDTTTDGDETPADATASSAPAANT